MVAVWEQTHWIQHSPLKKLTRRLFALMKGLLLLFVRGKAFSKQHGWKAIGSKGNEPWRSGRGRLPVVMDGVRSAAWWLVMDGLLIWASPEEQRP